MTIDIKTSKHQNDVLIKKGKSSALVRQNCKKRGPKGSANTDSMIKVIESINSIIYDHVRREDVIPLEFTCEIDYLLQYLKEYKSELSPGKSEENNLDILIKILSELEEPSTNEDVKKNVKEYMKTATSTGIGKIMTFCSERQIFLIYVYAFNKEDEEVTRQKNYIMDSMQEGNIRNSQMHFQAIKYLSELPLCELEILVKDIESDEMMTLRSKYLPVSMIANYTMTTHDKRSVSIPPFYVYTLNKETFEKHAELINKIKDNNFIFSVKTEEMLTEGKNKALKMTKDVFGGREEATDENALLFADTDWRHRDDLMIDINKRLKKLKTRPEIYDWALKVWNILYRIEGLKDRELNLFRKLTMNTHHKN